MMQTQRLILRPIRAEDTIKLNSTLLNHQHMRHTIQKNDPASCAEYFRLLEQQWHQYGFGVWCLTERLSGDTIGWGGLTIDEDEAGWGEELVYFLKPEKCGFGYAFEMSQAALNFGFHQLGLNKISAFAHTENASSLALLDKLGFQFIRYVPELERRYFEIASNLNNI